MPILKLETDAPEEELDFELAYQASLSTAQRFQMMDRESTRILRKLINNGQKKPFEILKRGEG